MKEKREMKKATLVFGIVIAVLAALFASACSRGGETSSNAANKNQSQQNSGMGQMMNSPDMKQMMDQMMKDPEMMRQMMTDPKMVDMMTRYMNEHASEMDAHMQLMMNNADHRRAMVEMLRRNPKMREQMKQIISDAEKPGGPAPAASSEPSKPKPKMSDMPGMKKP